MEAALEEPLGVAQLKELISSFPNARPMLLAYLEQRLMSLQSVEQVRALTYTIQGCQEDGLLTAGEAEQFSTRISTAVASGAVKGSLLDVWQFPALNTPERRPQLADESVAAFKAHADRQNELLAILAYIKGVDPASVEGTRVSTALLQAGVTRREISEIEREIPSLASRAKQELLGSATSQNPNDALVAKGRVAARSDVAAQPRSTGIYRPGMGGAVGGLFAGLIAYYGGTPAHTQYTIRANNGLAEYFDSSADLKIGDCVEVYVDKAKANESHWELDEVRFLPSTSCVP